MPPVGSLPEPTPIGHNPCDAVLAEAGGVWVIASRPDPAVLRAVDGTPIFPDGLPPMSSADTRAMLLHGMGLRKHDLVALDRDDGEGATNEFVDAVVNAASGLPIYVRHVIDDLASGVLTVNQAGELPPSLDAYFDGLLRRGGLTDAHRDLSVLLSVLALAREPLDREAMATLLCQGQVGDEQPFDQRVKTALALGASLLTTGANPDSEAGFRLYHLSLRDHLLGKASPLRGSVDDARRLLSRLATQWSTLRDTGLGRHLFRCGSAYDLSWGGPRGASEVSRRLTNFEYLYARAVSMRPADVHGLCEEYEKVPMTDAISEWRDLFRSHAHLFRRPEASRGQVLLQLAMERPTESVVAESASNWLRETGHSERWFWRFAWPGGRSDDACLDVFESGGELIMATVDEDGRLFTRDGEGATACWDSHSGRCIERSSDPDGLADAPAELAVDTTPGPYDQDRRGERALFPTASVSWAWNTLTIDFADGRQLVHDDAHMNHIIGVLAIDERRFLSWAWDGDLRIWSAEDGSLLGELRGHTMGVFGCRMLDERRLLSWSQDGCARIWDVDLAPPPTDLPRHRGSVHAAHAIDDDRFLTWADDGRFLVWSSKTGDCLGERGSRIQSLMGADVTRNTWILAWDAEGQLHVRTLADGTEVAVLEVGAGEVLGAEFVGEQLLAAWDHEGVVRLWDFESGNGWSIRAHDNWITSVQRLRDGQLLITSGDRTLSRWDIAAGQQVSRLIGHRDAVYGAVELPEGTLVSYALDGEIRVWPSADPSGSRLAKLPQGADFLIVSGDTLLAGSGDAFYSWSIPSLTALPTIDQEATTPVAHGFRLACGGDQTTCGQAVARPGQGLDLWLGHVESQAGDPAHEIFCSG